MERGIGCMRMVCHEGLRTSIGHPRRVDQPDPVFRGPPAEKAGQTSERQAGSFPSIHSACSGLQSLGTHAYDEQ
eukprot:8331935-Pyramimonas_sp.AAC.1